MVGSRQHGTMLDNNVEGWPGLRIDQVHVKARQPESVPRWKPNIFLINCGTNDALQDHNVSTAGNRMELMLNDLWSMSPRATILLSTLLRNKDSATERNVQNINNQIVTLTLRLQGTGRKVILVDMHSADGLTTDDLADETHPNDIGYGKMANIWYAGLLQASNLDWLQAPELVAGVQDEEIL
jgi:lysophospholipase L1-like esterase